MKEKDTTAKNHDHTTVQPVPSSKNNTGDSKNNSKPWMIVAIIAIVCLIGLSIYGYINMKNTNKKLADQQAQITDLQNKKKTLEDAAAAAASAATAAAGNAIKSAVTNTDTDKNQILASSKSFCTGAGNFSECSPKISKQLDKYADVVLSNKAHLLVIKDANNSWSVFLGSSDNLCSVGTDGDPVVAALNALCGR